MKLHKSLVEAVLSGMREIFINNRQADHVVEALLKSNKKWGKRDRSFIAENLYEICRWWSLITYCANKNDKISTADLNAIFYTWLIIRNKQMGLELAEDLPDWVHAGELDVDAILKNYDKAQHIRSVKHAIPDWLDKLGVKELSEKWVSELIGQNQQAPLYIRVNTQKSSIQQVRTILGDAETEIVPEIPDALKLVKRQNLVSRDSYQMGYFEIQDAGSQLIAPFLDPQMGDFVVDACAGAGGKSLHLASLMKNSGKIMAMDIVDTKLLELEKRAKRNGVTNIKTAHVSSNKDIEKFYNQVDRLLLDVPCSGLGVLRRNPDSKWKLTPKFLEQLKVSQAEIMDTYSKMVKTGGHMVYATCSILPSESEWQVAQFIENNNSSWQLIKEHRTSPIADNFDGFYMALLKRIV